MHTIETISLTAPGECAIAVEVMDAKDIIADVVQEPDARRRALIAEIEKLTKRPVLNYSATAWGSPNEIMHHGDIINLTRVMSKKPDVKGVDLILNSPGGLPEVAEKIITMLRHYFDDDLRVIVPESAKSAATIVALGADEILMGFCSELGPIDPQILVSTDAQGRGVFRSAHAIIQSVDSYVTKVHEAIAKNEPFEAYLRLLDSKPDLAFVEECRLAQRLSVELATRWLKAKMLKDNPKKAEETAEALSRADKLFSHGRALHYRYAIDELGLKVTYLPPEDRLWKKVWELHVRGHWTMLQNRFSKLIESASTTLSFNA